MKLKKLETILQTLNDFESPKTALEQYATPPHIAANAIHIATQNTGDIEGKIVGDLGCGCGMLTLGAALAGAAFCIGFEIDEEALKICLENKEEVEVENVDFIQCDILDMENSRWVKTFNTIILNPPFGTKGNKGIDLAFLKVAFSLAQNTVYSFHKISTIEHLKKFAKALNVKMEPMYNMRYNLKKTRTVHKQDMLDIQVLLVRFTLPINKNK